MGNLREGSPVELAYLAGIIDGEGCIRIEKQKKKRCWAPNYSMRIDIDNTNINLMNWMKGVFGGSFYKRDKGGNRKRIYSWSLSSIKAAKLLEEVQPYLKVKKEHAKVAIATQTLLSASFKKRLQNMKRGPEGKFVPNTRDEQVSKQLEVFYLKMKSLNQRGRPPATTERNRGYAVS